MNKSILIATFLSFSASTVMADEKAVSPVINADNSVTFTITMPDVDEMTLRGTFPTKRVTSTTVADSSGKLNKAEMKRDGDTWTYTTGVLASEIYTYFFEVDDDDEQRMLDPANLNVVRNAADTLNYFIIRGGLADDYVAQNVAHGKVEKVWYPSTLNDMQQRRMTVYLPAAYLSTPQRRFPVLYLLHGSGGDENSWQECGRAIEILDNLIADNRCQPMIVVMPNGNVNLAAAPGYDPNNPDIEPSSNNASSMFGKFEASFVKDIVGYVDQNYRTINDKSHRAIAGLSMGGLHTLFISANNPDLFDYVGLLSAQTTNALGDRGVGNMRAIGRHWGKLKENFGFIGGGKIDRRISNLTSEDLGVYENLDDKLAAQFANAPKLYYIAYGKDDFVKKLNEDLCERLDAAGYSYTLNISAGGHSWENWRRYLVDFLPRLFRD
jgi:enterochelin esterase family protein